jgi:hypothetical protein
MRYELNEEEKLMIVQKRLENIDLTIERSGNKLTATNINKDVLVAIEQEVNGEKKAFGITLNDIQSKQLYEFLKNRYELKKELEDLQNPERRSRPF